MSRITHADARKFWCKVYIAQILTEYPLTEVESMTLLDCVYAADEALEDYAARFGDEQLLAEIEANKARREQGNMP